MRETWVQFLHQENPLEKGRAVHSSILAWKTPWTEEPDGLQSMESQRVGHNWAANTFTFTLGPLETYLHSAWQIWDTSLPVSDPSWLVWVDSVQFNSVAQSCPTLCDPMNHSTPGLPDHHQLPKSTQTHVHWVSDAIQPSHPLLSPSPPALNLSQHQGLFKWLSSSYQVAKVLEFQLQHQSFQGTLRTDLL